MAAMRILGVVGVVLLVLIAGSAYAYVYRGGAGKTIDLRSQNKIPIVLEEEGFNPRDVRIARGTTVTFTTTRNNKFWPASNAHPSHTMYPEFDPQIPIDPGGSWSFTFDRAGEWGFHDHIRSYFTGTIYVE